MMFTAIKPTCNTNHILLVNCPSFHPFCPSKISEKISLLRAENLPYITACNLLISCLTKKIIINLKTDQLVLHYERESHFALTLLFLF